MENNLSIFSTDGEVSSEPRSPLNPLMPPSSNIPSKQIRRKSSFVVRVDSSEDIPSPHDSIFEALYTPGHDEDETTDKFDTIPLNTPVALEDFILGENDENIRQDNVEHDSIEEAEFLYGRGTVLDTIAEQKSYGTLRTQGTVETGLEMPNFPFVRHRDSFALTQLPSRRRQAFSHDDIDLLQESYHEACAMIERETQKPLVVHELYAQPMSPIHEPIGRPETPDGMPSWTASQSPAPPRANQPQAQPVSTTTHRLRRLLHITPKPKPTTIVNRSVSDPIRGRQAPRFRPPRSVYGNIEQHPFLNVPKARVVSRFVAVESPKPSSMRGKNKNKIRSTLGVRFTHSATARDSEMNNLRTAMERSSTSAPHPIEPFQDHAAAPRIVDIRCSHAKGRAAAAAKQLQVQSHNHGSTDPPSFEYVVQPPTTITPTSIDRSPIATSPTQDRPLTPFSFAPSSYNPVMESNILRTPSISSTAHLMSGGLPNSTSQIDVTSRNTIEVAQEKINVIECWKCKLSRFGHKFDHFKRRSVDVLSFVCCGHDVREDASPGVHLRGGGRTESLLAPRIVSLEGRYH